MLPSGKGAAEQHSEQEELETYLLLLLSDSNLPTGGFVASSGLESFFTHGFLHDSPPVSAMAQYGQPQQGLAGTSTRAMAPSQAQLASSTLSFAKSTLHSYCRSSFPFLVRVHTVVSQYLNLQVQRRTNAQNGAETMEQYTEGRKADIQACISSISWLDHSYHTLVLNHVARRASKAQGIALLTLYSKAFAQPIRLPAQTFNGSRLGEKNSGSAEGAQSDEIRIDVAAELVERLKFDIRQSASLHSRKQSATWLDAGGQHGHLPICWAVFSACLGISLSKALFLHLFLQARSLFSSSIRLNSVGPYLAHQIMRYQLRLVVNDIMDEMKERGCTPLSETMAIPCANLASPSSDMQTATSSQPTAYSIPDEKMLEESATSHPTSLFRSTGTMVATPVQTAKVQPLRAGKAGLIPVLDQDESQSWAWDWADDHTDQYLHAAPNQEPTGKDSGFWTRSAGPATTFPLGEIVQARHDQLHSRLFNS